MEWFRKRTKISRAAQLMELKPFGKKLLTMFLEKNLRSLHTLLYFVTLHCTFQSISKVTMCGISLKLLHTLFMDELYCCSYSNIFHKWNGKYRKRFFSENEWQFIVCYVSIYLLVFGLNGNTTYLQIAYISL